jgi:hypothetical protein
LPPICAQCVGIEDEEPADGMYVESIHGTCTEETLRRRRLSVGASRVSSPPPRGITRAYRDR